MAIQVIEPNVVRGGSAIPLGNNFYYMLGRKHKNGGIHIGKYLEVERGEIMQMGGKSIRVFSSVPFLNGKSPAKLLLAGANPNRVFAAQENYKDRHKLNDDGSRRAKFGGRYKARFGIGDLIPEYTNGQAARDIVNDTIITQCAKWQNQRLRNANLIPTISAWQQTGKKVFSGYNTDKAPKVYTDKDYDEYNKAAADSVLKAFRTADLDTSKVYTVNMYYPRSTYKEEAYRDGYKDSKGTHTGYVKYSNRDKDWNIYHEMNGKVHVDKLRTTQGRNRPYAVTAVFEPQENTIINRIATRAKTAYNRLFNH